MNKHIFVAIAAALLSYSGVVSCAPADFDPQRTRLYTQQELSKGFDADRDRSGKTWLNTAPKIKLFSVKDARPPYPRTREEQAPLFKELPDHVARMVLLKVNTRLREKEVCGLRLEVGEGAGGRCDVRGSSGSTGSSQ
jgi:hypothetical protein